MGGEPELRSIIDMHVNLYHVIHNPLVTGNRYAPETNAINCHCIAGRAGVPTARSAARETWTAQVTAISQTNVGLQPSTKLLRHIVSGAHLWCHGNKACCGK